MPLLDHFHPPLSQRRGWEGFHGLWAGELVARLNGEILGDDYFADFQIHVGGPVEVEVDVATLTEPVGGASGGSGTATAVWTPPVTNLIVPATFADDIEVQVFSTVAGATLVAAIELVSPANKDRPDTRAAFAAKCVSYLTRGVGLIVVDIVTNRLANLHNEVMATLGRGDPFLLPAVSSTYAVAYRPTRRLSGDQIELWPVSLTLGQPLPVLPLALRNAATVPVDLEETYNEACRRSKIA